MRIRAVRLVAPIAYLAAFSCSFSEPRPPVVLRVNPARVMSNAGSAKIAVVADRMILPFEVDEISSSLVLRDPNGVKVPIVASLEDLDLYGPSLVVTVPATAHGWHTLDLDVVPQWVDATASRLFPSQPTLATVTADSSPTLSRVNIGSKDGVVNVFIFFSEDMVESSLIEAVRVSVGAAACSTSTENMGGSRAHFRCSAGLAPGSRVRVTVSGDAVAVAGGSFRIRQGASNFTSEFELPAAGESVEVWIQ